MGSRGGFKGEVVELDEGDQKIQIASCKINKYWGCNVELDHCSRQRYMVYLRVVKSEF